MPTLMEVTNGIRRQPSLRDLAKELQVSHTTVALALKNDTRISLEVRKRVQAAARKHGYFANDIPKNLFTGRSDFVGLSFPNFRDSFYARMLEGAQEQLWNAGKVSLVFSSHEDLEREEAVLERCARLRVDGVIFVPAPGAAQQAHFAEVLKKSTALVTVERSIESLSLPCVAPDEAMGILRATLLLLETGRRRPVFCSSNLDAATAVATRIKGYANVMKRAGLPQLSGRLNVLRSSRADTLSEFDALLNLPPEGKADAIVAASDETAEALVSLLQEVGLRVPEDVSVTGFGNRARDTGYRGPALTTIDLRPEKIGGEAALIALNLRDNPGDIPQHLLVEPEIVPGATTLPSQS